MSGNSPSLHYRGSRDLREHLPEGIGTAPLLLLVPAAATTATTVSTESAAALARS